MTAPALLAAIVTLAVLLAALVVGIGAWAYSLGWDRARLRARAQALAVRDQPGPLGPMPPERAWALCADRLLRALEKGVP